MHIVIQRVKNARVITEDNEIAEIGKGLVLLVGFKKGDDGGSISQRVKKILNLRIFEDSSGKMNLSILDVGGDILVVSNFTLVADLRKGNRPSFDTSLPPQDAQILFEQFVSNLRLSGITVKTGAFGKQMIVSLANDGPVTFCLNEDTL